MLLLGTGLVETQQSEQEANRIAGFGTIQLKLFIDTRKSES